MIKKIEPKHVAIGAGIAAGAAAVASAAVAFKKGKGAEAVDAFVKKVGADDMNKIQNKVKKAFVQMGEGYKKMWNATTEFVTKKYNAVKDWATKTFKKAEKPAAESQDAKAQEAIKDAAENAIEEMGDKSPFQG